AKEIPALQDYANRMGLIFVMPDGRNLWYWDSISPKVQNMESFITNDLIPYIDTKYPTLAQSSSRAIIPSNIICSSSTTDYIALTINNWLLD
ncbi:MAG: hypothetical protein K2K81_10245, partial [Muribaculaceae bacterium]|nr:hypothetical protein [Muribaculaceae bacterium]